ncbi:MAG: hypothetical protein RMK89_14560, partial [Armatimonadota bacterium]|nr:hypothetical protein [Armatimonadota bacterium]MDW8144666.1 hypothetical protein [Armatimonadota bacterium]
WDLRRAPGAAACAPAAFNPTVVRLGRWPQPPGRPSSWLFQSHCGAIGTPQRPRAARPPSPLSIPLWCDWDARARDRHTAPSPSFQSHCG